jgi:uncharacterized membrane protein HdeD (DUF308 family)
MSQSSMPSQFGQTQGQLLGTKIDPSSVYVAEGAVLVTLGVISIIAPAVTSLIIALFVGWLLLIGGLFRAAALYQQRHAPGFWWSAIATALAIILGLMLIIDPIRAMLSLTIVLMIMFIVEGITSILTALDFRKHVHNWGLLLFSGLIDLALAYMVYLTWPGSGIAVIGLLVGVYLIFTGMSVSLTGLASRSVAAGRKTPEQTVDQGFPRGSAPSV